ncbi:MAG TPA: hypothetical protein VEC11_15040 [Allosphingosinicella sp.]|nr:hypothetical protein [Allosphingosinicella sp.]
MTYKKLSPRRLAHLAGPRRGKPPVRAQTREVRQLVDDEHELLQSLIRDADVRRAFWRGAGRQLEPLVVWTDFDHTYLHTELNPKHLRPWEDLSEYLKMQLGFLVCMEFGGYSFTVNLPEPLVADWKQHGRSVERMIQRRLGEQLKASGLVELPYAYAIETRSKSTKSRTHLHLYGFFLAEDPLVSVRFKVAAENGLRRLHGRLVGKGSDVDVERSYDVDTGDGRGRGRWVGYYLKSVERWDARVPGRRLYMSRPLTQAAREFWELLRMDVVVEVP